MWLGLPDGVLSFIQDGNTNNHKCNNIIMQMSNSDCGREWKHDSGQVVWGDEASSGDEPDQQVSRWCWLVLMTVATT